MKLELGGRCRQINRIEDRHIAADASWTMNFETNLEIYRECSINFSKATSCRYVLNVDISEMPGNRLESLRVKQSGAFDLIYDTNFREKSSIRSSIRSEKKERIRGGRGGRKICSNITGYRNRSGGKTIGSLANETANDEQTSFRKYLSRGSINENGFFDKALNTWAVRASLSPAIKISVFVEKKYCLPSNPQRSTD